MNPEQIDVLVFLALAGIAAIASHSLIRIYLLAVVCTALVTVLGMVVYAVIGFTCMHLPMVKISWVGILAFLDFSLATLPALIIGLPYALLRRRAKRDDPEGRLPIFEAPSRWIVTLSAVLCLSLTLLLFHLHDGMEWTNREDTVIDTIHQGSMSDLDRALSETHMDVNADGGQALYIASFYGRADMVALLLKKGANPRLHSHNHGTPLQATLTNRHDDVAHLLQQAGATQ